jgi:hypothetical protein
VGRWYDITPKGLSKRDADHAWVFAVYWEPAAERDDQTDHEWFLFRDGAFERFGVIERSEWTHLDAHRARAARVVRDEAYRRSLLSHDPSLPTRWQRR